MSLGKKLLLRPSWQTVVIAWQQPVNSNRGKVSSVRLRDVPVEELFGDIRCYKLELATV
jgi:hypothetical protein